jgi:hypothetical protein
MQTGSSETLIGSKSGQTTYVPLWHRMEWRERGYGLQSLRLIQNRNRIHTRLILKWCCYITVDPETPTT